MAEIGNFGEIAVALDDDCVATAEIRRPPNNFFSHDMIASLADALEALDAEPRCRVVLFCSEGKHFCAGANFGKRDENLTQRRGRHLYDEAVRLFSTRKPIVAAIQGAAVGGGLGLALIADFRVAAPEARFSANFSRLGFHHGFGLSATLPRLIGEQRAMNLLYTGRRVPGEEALAIGLCDDLAPLSELRERTRALCVEIATSAPLAVESIRETLRGDLAEKVRLATRRERWEQERLQTTADFKEGVAAMGERRTPNFTRSSPVDFARLRRAGRAAPRPLLILRHDERRVLTAEAEAVDLDGAHGSRSGLVGDDLKLDFGVDVAGAGRRDHGVGLHGVDAGHESRHARGAGGVADVSLDRGDAQRVVVAPLKHAVDGADLGAVAHAGSGAVGDEGVDSSGAAR